jgi:putative MATE family efflux protein
VTIAAPLRHRHDAEILRLAVPAFFNLVAEPLFLLADSAIVGHLGTAQLAGVGVAGAILSTVLSLCIFLAYGSTGAVARRLGAGDQPGAVRQGIDGLWVGLFIGVSLTVIMFASSDTLVDAFGVDAAATHEAEVYLRIAAFGLPAALGMFAVTGLLRGLQDTRTPLFVAVGANLVNVVLNYALVYGADMGVAGSALGTVLAQWGALGAYVGVVLARSLRLGVAVGPSLPGMKRSLFGSAPLFLRNVALRFVVFVSFALAADMGSAELAAHQLAFTIWSALALALDAVAIAGQALVGRYLGARDITGAREASRRMVEWSLVMGTIAGVGIFASRELLPSLFTEDPAVQAYLSDVLIIVAIMQPWAGWVFALDGVLIGAGDLRYVAFAQLLTVAIFLPIAGAVFTLDLGLQGLWCAYAAWTLARLAVMGHRMLGDEWAVAGATRG